MQGEVCEKNSRPGDHLPRRRKGRLTGALSRRAVRIGRCGRRKFRRLARVAAHPKLRSTTARQTFSKMERENGVRLRRTGEASPLFRGKDASKCGQDGRAPLRHELPGYIRSSMPVRKWPKPGVAFGEQRRRDACPTLPTPAVAGRDACVRPPEGRAALTTKALVLMLQELGRSETAPSGGAARREAGAL